MAEFQEVMRQWGRLCASSQMAADDRYGCTHCVLGENRADVCGPYPKDNAEEPGEIERLVVEWAAENPEPVYPKWGEWLLAQGIIKPGIECIYGFARASIEDKFFEPIPADIAEKLGIEPKEGV